MKIFRTLSLAGTRLENLLPGNPDQKDFHGSAQYWEERYHRNGTSGMGSYGALARLKSGYINSFIRENQIRSVIDFGAGDGNQLRFFEVPRYVGLDIAPTTINRLRTEFQRDSSKEFHLHDPLQERAAPPWTGELGLSLDVLYHLVEDNVFHAYLRDLFAASQKYVIIYSSDHDQDPCGLPHVRDRHFTPIVEARFPEWNLEEVRHNPLGLLSRSDFFVYRRKDGCQAGN